MVSDSKSAVDHLSQAPAFKGEKANGRGKEASSA